MSSLPLHLVSSRRFILAAALSVLGLSTAWAQITLVHATSCGPQTFPTSTCTIPATGGGNLIVIGVQMDGGVSTSTVISSVTDNVGNSYVEAGAARAIDTAAGAVVDIWYAKNSISGTTIVTINPSTAVSSAGAVIWEFSGVDPATPLDQVSVLNSQPSSTTAAGATITTTAASEVVVALVDVSGNVSGITAGNPFLSDSGLKGNGWAHLVTTTSGPYSASWALNVAGTYASTTASFKAATSGGGSPPTSGGSCDLNRDGATTVVDVQLITNMYLGIAACTANIVGSGVCNVPGAPDAVVQDVVSGALGGHCPHLVTLNLAASSSATGYNVYRSTTSGGPYSLLTTSPLTSATFTDYGVYSNKTYYYVSTAVNSAGESGYSNQIAATIPIP